MQTTHGSKGCSILLKSNLKKTQKGKKKFQSLLTDPNYPRTYYMPHETHDYYL